MYESLIALKLSIVYFKRYPFSPDQEIVEPDWEIFLRDTANFIVQEQSPKRYFKSFLNFKDTLSLVF